MPAIGHQPLPLSIVALRGAVEGLEAHDDVCALMVAISYALVADKPRKGLNLRLTRLNRARPGLFRKLSVWLKTDAVKQAARDSGVYWAWLIWRRAAVAMHRGVVPHAAFGMDVGGRPALQGLTLAEEAAIHALHLLDSGQAVDENEALDTAFVLYQPRKDDTRKALSLAAEVGAEARAAISARGVEKRGGKPKKV